MEYSKPPYTVQLYSNGEWSKVEIAGYVRVSTDEQAESGAGRDAQRARITEEAERRGWHVTWFVDDGYSGASKDRPALSEALTGLKDGTYDMLVSAKLDRLSRSVVHLGSLIEQAEKEGWSLVLLDFDVDTSKPTGRLVAHVLAAVAEFERQRIRERTREALAQVKANGTRLGRPRQLPDGVVARISQKRGDGLTLRAIADGLNEDSVPTAQGGRQWWPATVRSVLQSVELDREAELAQDRA
jgi:DNA invertase Pin-like site-specific DNA recombinase